MAVFLLAVYYNCMIYPLRVWYVFLNRVNSGSDLYSCCSEGSNPMSLINWLSYVWGLRYRLNSISVMLMFNVGRDLVYFRGVMLLVRMPFRSDPASL